MTNFFEKLKKPEAKKEKIKESREKLFKKEGKLAIDLFQTRKELIIQSAIAGIKSEDLDISVEGDVLIIKGEREKPPEGIEQNYFYQECYWGPFSREIILPVEIDPSRIKAAMKEGILEIRMPIIHRAGKRKIEIKE